MNLNEFLFQLHSGFRWIVLVAAIVSIIINLIALFTKRPASDNLVKNGMRFWTISMDIQWLIGLITILSMWVFSGLFSVTPTSVWEHTILNTVAVAVAHSYMAFRKRSDRAQLLGNLGTTSIALLIIIVAIASVGGWS